MPPLVAGLAGKVGRSGLSFPCWAGCSGCGSRGGGPLVLTALIRQEAMLLGLAVSSRFRMAP